MYKLCYNLVIAIGVTLCVVYEIHAWCVLCIHKMNLLINYKQLRTTKYTKVKENQSPKESDRPTDYEDNSFDFLTMTCSRFFVILFIHTCLCYWIKSCFLLDMYTTSLIFLWLYSLSCRAHSLLFSCFQVAARWKPSLGFGHFVENFRYKQMYYICSIVLLCRKSLLVYAHNLNWYFHL